MVICWKKTLIILPNLLEKLNLLNLLHKLLCPKFAANLLQKLSLLNLFDKLNLLKVKSV